MLECTSATRATRQPAQPARVGRPRRGDAAAARATSPPAQHRERPHDDLDPGARRSLASSPSGQHDERAVALGVQSRGERVELPIGAVAAGDECR